jgi:hypothetical protein
MKTLRAGKYLYSVEISDGAVIRSINPISNPKPRRESHILHDYWCQKWDRYIDMLENETRDETGNSHMDYRLEVTTARREATKVSLESKESTSVEVDTAMLGFS